MNRYEKIVKKEVLRWHREMQKPPSLSNKATKGFQTRFNKLIPEKIHELITKGIKQMTRAVLFGAASQQISMSHLVSFLKSKKL